MDLNDSLTEEAFALADAALALVESDRIRALAAKQRRGLALMAQGGLERGKPAADIPAWLAGYVVCCAIGL